MSAAEEKSSQAFWDHQEKLWRRSRIAADGGYMSDLGFVPGAWQPESDVLPQPINAVKPVPAILRGRVDINSPLGRAILESEFMPYENNPQSASIFPNKDKAEGDKRPNAKGALYFDRDFLAALLTQDGPLIKAEISLWTKVAASGTPYWSGSLSTPYVAPGATPAPAPAPAPKEIDQTIPF